MARYKQSDKDIFDVLQREIDYLKRRIKHLENQQYPTLPIYTVGDYPDPLQQGAIFITSSNDLRFYKDGTVYNAGP